MNIESSSISEVTYQPQTEFLYVTFKRDNKMYQYEGVPQDVYDEFLKADSKGVYFNYIIAPNYPFRKL